MVQADLEILIEERNKMLDQLERIDMLCEDACEFFSPQEVRTQCFRASPLPARAGLECHLYTALLTLHGPLVIAADLEHYPGPTAVYANSEAYVT
jgi:hypothetical protein